MFKFFIRISSFVTKETVEIFRQPKLILTLVLAPFLIMLLFGLAYPEQNRTLRTTFVAEDPGAEKQIKLFTDALGSSLAHQEVVTNKAAALAKLARNQTDLVIVLPTDPLATVENNHQAEFQVYHNEVDPFQVGYIQSVVRIYVDEINRRILQSMAEQGQEDAGSLQTSLQDAVKKTEALRQSLPSGDSNINSRVQEVQNNLSDLNERLTRFRSVGSGILVNPFTANISSLAEVQYDPTKFFAPAVIILLLQHLSVTFGSLSIVREERSGITELFRVAPLNAFETLVGKFLSYLLFEVLLAAIITVLAVFALKVPMFGQWQDYALAVLVVLFTSLGVGFLISLIVETDTQAVQYSMLLLLASIFFSGFFLDLRLMWEPIKVLAWSLPATYGIRMLQDIMLRGSPSAPIIFLGIFAIGVVLFFINWFRLRHKLEG